MVYLRWCMKILKRTILILFEISLSQTRTPSRENYPGTSFTSVKPRGVGVEVRAALDVDMGVRRCVDDT